MCLFCVLLDECSTRLTTVNTEQLHQINRQIYKVKKEISNVVNSTRLSTLNSRFDEQTLTLRRGGDYEE